MRTRYRIASLLCAPLAVALLAGCDASNAHALKATGDTYVSATSPSQNFQGATGLGVNTDPTKGVQKMALMNFQPSAAGVSAADFGGAFLHVHLTSVNGKTVPALKIYSTGSFSAKTVTWNSRPAMGKYLGGSPATASGSWVNFNVTDAVKAALPGSQFMGLSVVAPGAADVKVGSLESKNPATLVVIAKDGTSTTSSTSPASTTTSSTSTSTSSTSTSTSTSSTSTSTSSTTSTTSPGGGGLKCSNPKKLTGNQGSMNDGAYLIQQDVWSGEGQQTMDVCSFANWRANVTESGAPETGVKTYPDSGKTYTDWSGSCTQPPKISSFPKLTSTYSETAPGGKNSYDWAYDIFLNGSGCGKFHEIMIWNDFRNISVPNAQATPTIGGIAYDFYHSSDAGYLQFRMKNQNTSGTVDLMAIFKYLQDNGFLKADGSDEVQFVQYGPEVLTTYGVNTPFYLNNFSITDK